ncbi:hypothetical protein KL930_002808 [Ogataea haglerorum]|nr:hypothetical protein KL930_002808 [Ogataea haglerorum]KAG7778721.1 hypothetical protein KL922_001892 [Ogataea haglerorum]
MPNLPSATANLWDSPSARSSTSADSERTIAVDEKRPGSPHKNLYQQLQNVAREQPTAPRANSAGSLPAPPNNARHVSSHSTASLSENDFVSAEEGSSSGRASEPDSDATVDIADETADDTMQTHETGQGPKDAAFVDDLYESFEAPEIAPSQKRVSSAESAEPEAVLAIWSTQEDFQKVHKTQPSFQSICDPKKHVVSADHFKDIKIRDPVLVRDDNDADDEDDEHDTPAKEPRASFAAPDVSLEKTFHNPLDSIQDTDTSKVSLGSIHLSDVLLDGDDSFLREIEAWQPETHVQPPQKACLGENRQRERPDPAHVGGRGGAAHAPQESDQRRVPGQGGQQQADVREQRAAPGAVRAGERREKRGDRRQGLGDRAGAVDRHGPDRAPVRRAGAAGRRADELARRLCAVVVDKAGRARAARAGRAGPVLPARDGGAGAEPARAGAAQRAVPDRPRQLDPPAHDRLLPGRVRAVCAREQGVRARGGRVARRRAHAAAALRQAQGPAGGGGGEAQGEAEERAGEAARRQGHRHVDTVRDPPCGEGPARARAGRGRLVREAQDLVRQLQGAGHVRVQDLPARRAERVDRRGRTHGGPVQGVRGRLQHALCAAHQRARDAADEHQERVRAGRAGARHARHAPRGLHVPGGRRHGGVDAALLHARRLRPVRAPRGDAEAARAHQPAARRGRRVRGEDGGARPGRPARVQRPAAAERRVPAPFCERRDDLLWLRQQPREDGVGGRAGDAGGQKRVPPPAVGQADGGQVRLAAPFLSADSAPAGGPVCGASENSATPNCHLEYLIFARARVCLRMHARLPSI